MASAARSIGRWAAFGTVAASFLVSLSGVASAAPADDPEAPFAQNYPAVNAPGGAYFHGFAVDSLEGVVTGWGVYNGDTVEAYCWIWSDPVGPYKNHIWVLAKNLSRPTLPDGTENSGYVNTHYLDDGMAADHANPAMTHCGQN